MNKIIKYILSILCIFYFLTVITFLLLLNIQSITNHNFNFFYSPKNIKELLFYEQFSYEIYSSINTNLILDLKIQDECEVNYQPLNFFLKLNPNYTFKYTVNITNLFNIKFCVPIYEKLTNKYNYFELRYNNLLKHSININDIKNYDKNNPNNLNNICEVGYKPCGILDTMNNILCLPKKYNCPLNDIIISRNKNSSLIDNGYDEITLNNSFLIYLNTKENIERPIIITNFISFDKPWNHEYQQIIEYNPNKLSKLNFKKRIKAFDDYDIYMKIVPFLNFNNITLNDILNWEKDNDNLKSVINESVEISKYYFLFHKNYIGFKNYEELLNFKKLFKEDDYKDNPLYKCSKGLKPSLITFIFSIILLIVLFPGTIIFIILDQSIITLSSSPFFYIYGVVNLIYFIIYIPLYFIDKAKLVKIQFSFDVQIQNVLNLYHQRIKQKLYGVAINMISISLVPFFVFVIIKLTKKIKKYCGFCGIF